MKGKFFSGENNLFFPIFYVAAQKQCNHLQRVTALVLFALMSVVAFGQTNSTGMTMKQSLPQQPGFVLQDGTVYTVDATMTLDGRTEGGFINGLAVAEGASVTLYIPAGVTLTVYGQDADGLHGAGAGIYVPATSTLYITGEGTLIALRKLCSSSLNMEL